MSMSEIEHLRQLMDERDKRYDQRFQAQERALAERANELGERLKLLNELRGDIATKAELGALDKMVSEVKDRMNLQEGKGVGAKDNRAGIYAAIGAVGVIVGLLVVVMNTIGSG